MRLKEKLSKNYINAIGWSSRQKYLLIESDDWGAVRMPSKEVYKKLIDHNIEVDTLHIDKLDAVESQDDLNALFNTLENFKDREGNSAVLTAYHVVANPNFEKIKASDKNEYFYETILETYKRHPHTKQVPNLINEGIKKGIYIPQYHGREHVHVKRYLEALNSESKKEQIAFENKAIVSSKSTTCKNPYLAQYFKGFDYNNSEEHEEIENIHRDGLKIFKEIFGMSSITFMAQGSVWGDHILPMLKEEGVQLIPGQQLIPTTDDGHKIANKKWGSKNKLGQVHWRRNCKFEPARNQDFDWINKCLAEIKIAFRWGKPAVISSHRENFIGSIFEENRTQSLAKLEELLTAVQKNWPEVKFISTAQLAELMMTK